MKAITYHYIRNECNRYKGIHPIDWKTFSDHIDYFQNNYTLFKLGDGIEKKEEDFAAEVAATAAGL